MPRQHLDRAVPGLGAARALVLAVDLTDLLADGVVRRERRQGVLEDHRDLVAAQFLHAGPGGADQLVAVQPDLATDRGVLRVVQAEHGQVGHRFAGAGLADDAQRGALLHVEGEPVHGVDDAVLGMEVDGQVTDGEERS
jgi:hypothetical protein